MNAFKEWLSDYLRYFALLLAVLLALGAIFLGVKLYQSTQTVEGDPDSVTIIEGTESEMETETETETMSETETETEASTEKVTEAETVTEKVTEKITEKETAVTEKKLEAGASQTEKKPETAVPQTEPLIVINPSETQRQTEQRQTNPPQTDPPETDPPEPVYLTMTGTCYFRSYADYGDNIIGEYPAGTVVEFLEDVGGWYKVQVDGMVGYMGARFFN